MAPKIKAVSASVQLLEKQLTSADPVVRQSGVNSVPKLKAPADQILDCATRVLTHENWYARRAASDALAFAVLRGADTVGPQAAGLAGKSLTNEDSEIQRLGGKTLVQIAAQPKDPLYNGQALPAPKEPDEFDDDLIDEDPVDKLSNGAAAELVARLEHDDYHVRENATIAFGGLGQWAESHASALAKLVGDASPMVRHAALRAIDSLGAFASPGASGMAAWLESPEEVIQSSARKALLMLGKHDGPAAAAAAIAVLDSPNVMARRGAAQVLVDLGEYAAVHCVRISEMLEDVDCNMRSMCRKVLVSAATADPKEVANCVSVVIRMMEHPDEDISRAAVDCTRALSSIVPKFARSQGRFFIEDNGTLDGEKLALKKIRAVAALSGAGEHAEPYLEDICRELESSDWRLRRAVVHCMADLKSHASGVGAKEVCKRFLSEEPDVRRAAVDTIGRMGIHAGSYAERVEAMLESEGDEDVLKVIRASVDMLRACGALQTKGGADGEKKH